MAPKFTIFIPTYNEKETIAHSVERVLRYLDLHAISAEVLICDNGSTDGTPQTLNELMASDPRVRIELLDERGAGRAFARGVAVAAGDWIVTLDADLSSDLEFLAYVSQLSQFCDVIVGTKTFGRQRRTFLRVFGSQLYILITQYLFDLQVSDFSLGAKAFQRSALLPLLPYLDPWTGHIFECILYFQQRNKKILQIGISCEDNRESRFNLFHEGVYRFRHLAQIYKRIRNPNSWFHQKL